MTKNTASTLVKPAPRSAVTETASSPRAGRNRGGEKLDDRVHRHRRGVLERVAHRVADDGGRVERGSPFPSGPPPHTFLALSHAPPALAMKIAGRTEQGDRDQVATKK